MDARRGKCLQIVQFRECTVSDLRNNVNWGACAAYNCISTVLCIENWYASYTLSYSSQCLNFLSWKNIRPENCCSQTIAAIDWQQIPDSLYAETNGENNVSWIKYQIAPSHIWRFSFDLATLILLRCVQSKAMIMKDKSGLWLAINKTCGTSRKCGLDPIFTMYLPAAWEWFSATCSVKIWGSFSTCRCSTAGKVKQGWLSWRIHYRKIWKHIVVQNTLSSSIGYVFN